MNARVDVRGLNDCVLTERVLGATKEQRFSLLRVSSSASSAANIRDLWAGLLGPGAFAFLDGELGGVNRHMVAGNLLSFSA